MFWEKWIPKKYLVRSTICGVEVVLTDNSYNFHYSILEYKNKKLNLIESGTSEETLVLPEKIKKNKIPVVICVSGKGLILKKIEQLNNSNLSELISQNLAAANSGDFYLQLYRQNTSGYLCILRKEKWDEILKNSDLSKYEIADVFLGPASISSVPPIFSKYNSVQTNTYSITLNNDSIETIASSNTEDKIAMDLEGITLDPSSVLSFSSGFTYLTDQLVYESPVTEFSSYRAKHSEKNKTKVLAYSFISLAFVLCITNLLFFSNLFNKNQALESELNLYQGKYEQINELLENYEKRKGLIEKAGILEENTTSKYADKIASTIPEEVILKEWVNNPAKKNIEEDSLMVFEKNNITIKGNCNKSLIVNEWINVLKGQNFIKDVNLEKFSYNIESNQPNFEVKIVTN